MVRLTPTLDGPAVRRDGVILGKGIEITNTGNSCRLLHKAEATFNRQIGSYSNLDGTWCTFSTVGNQCRFRGNIVAIGVNLNCELLFQKGNEMAWNDRPQTRLTITRANPGDPFVLQSACWQGTFWAGADAVSVPITGNRLLFDVLQEKRNGTGFPAGYVSDFYGGAVLPLPALALGSNMHEYPDGNNNNDPLYIRCTNNGDATFCVRCLVTGNYGTTKVTFAGVLT